VKGLLVASALVATTVSAAPFEASGIANWATPPPPTVERAFVPPVAAQTTLGNGMRLVTVEDHQLPLVAMSLLVPGAGTAYDPKSKPGLAELTADLLDEGAAGMSAIEIAEAQDRLGATIAVTAGVDAAQISVETLATTYDATVDLVAKIAMTPLWDRKDFDRVKADRATELELRRDRPREVVSDVLIGGLYGASSPYGHPGGGERASFRTIALADVVAFYRQHWNPAEMTMIVVGDIDPVAVRTKLDTTLGSWKPIGTRMVALDVAPQPNAHRLLVVDRPGAQQSDIRVGIIGIDRRDPRYFAFETLSTLVGGGFTSRVVQRLREQLGIAYSAHAEEIYRREPGPFAIATAIVTPETGRGLKEMLAILDQLASAEVPAAELEKAKQNMIRALPARFETNVATVEALSELVLCQLPVDWYAHFADGIRNVSAKAVLAEARRSLLTAKMTVAVVGDLSKVRADLDKLGLGEPLLHDPYGVPMALPANR